MLANAFLFSELSVEIEYKSETENLVKPMSIIIIPWMREILIRSALLIRSILSLLSVEIVQKSENLVNQSPNTIYQLPLTYLCHFNSLIACQFLPL